jgi:hypothetical protein
VCSGSGVGWDFGRIKALFFFGGQCRCGHNVHAYMQLRPPPKQSRWGIMFKADMQGGCKVSCSMMLMMTVLAV